MGDRGRAGSNCAHCVKRVQRGGGAALDNPAANNEDEDRRQDNRDPEQGRRTANECMGSEHTRRCFGYPRGYETEVRVCHEEVVALEPSVSGTPPHDRDDAGKQYRKADQG